jgi:hypothetical protein
MEISVFSVLGVVTLHLYSVKKQAGAAEEPDCSGALWRLALTKLRIWQWPRMKLRWSYDKQCETVS